MMAPPSAIGRLPVIKWTTIDHRHEATGACRHLVAGAAMPRPAGLAICSGDGGFYLFYCDAGWTPLTETWHESLEDAVAQAEFEFAGVSETWV